MILVDRFWSTCYSCYWGLILGPSLHSQVLWPPLVLEELTRVRLWFQRPERQHWGPLVCEMIRGRETGSVFSCYHAALQCHRRLMSPFATLFLTFGFLRHPRARSNRAHWPDRPVDRTGDTLQGC